MLFRCPVITSTNTFLITGLKDGGNDRVWGEFCARYRPVLVSFAQRLGLLRDDAEDAAQEALIAFAEGCRQGEYDPGRGRLRTWLFGIARHKVMNLRRLEGRRHIAHPEDRTRILDSAPDEASMSATWEAEWRRAIIEVCLQEVRRIFEPATVRAFELFVLQEWPAERVAAELGISRNAVFKAKHRVLTRMREAYRYLDANW